MARFLKQSKKEIGISPDDLLFRGEKKIENVLLSIIDFDAESLIDTKINNIQEAETYINKRSVTWLNVDGLHDTDIMSEIAERFDLDRLILADVMDTQARPRVHEYKNCISISVKMLQQDELTSFVTVENLSLILTDSMLITFQERKGDVFEPVRLRIRNHKKRIRNSGSDYLAVALLDIVVDNYIYIISVLGEKIEDLEDNILQEPRQNILDRINTYKRELNFLRRHIKPAKDLIANLTKLDSDLIAESTDFHLKELLNNINHAIEATDSYRDILSDQLNIYHTTISSRLNDIMKFLTIFSVIFIPLTFIAGIYGTNFDVLPELHYKYSYFVMWGVIIFVAIIMLFYFRRKKWI